MDKFNQSIETTKKSIDPSVLIEAGVANTNTSSSITDPLDLFGGLAAEFNQNRRAGRFGKYLTPDYNASNVFYLVGGSKSLDALGEEYKIKDREGAFNNETNKLQKKIEYVQEWQAKVLVSLNTANSKHHIANISRFKYFKGLLSRLLDKLETELAKKSEPFNEEGKLTGNATITNPQTFNDGYTTLPLLIYKTFAAVIHQQNQNYAKISDFVDMEIRSREKYSIKTALGKPTINMKNAQESMLDYIKRQEQTNSKLPKIIYIKRSQALEYDKQEEKGSIGSRLFKKTIGAVGNDIKTYTKGPNMTL